MAEEKTVDPNEGKSTQEPEKQVVPEKKEEPAGDDLPEKFKGKSASEIAKSYLELEKNSGKTAQEKDKAEKSLLALTKLIEEDEELKEKVVAKINKLSGKEEPLKTEKKQSRDEAGLTLENQAFDKFEEKWGINHIQGEKKQELHKKIGSELMDMLDPRGTKTYREVLDDIPLNRLPQYLDKAYRLATIGDREEQARAEGILQARQNSEATFSSMASTGVNGKQTTLTPEQREAAKKMGISEERYIANLKAINEGN